MKTITIGEILTDKELKRAIALYEVAPPGQFARICSETIIQPILSRVNKATGQENDALFLAYLIENAFNQAVK